MSTRGCIARTDGNGWTGRYHHWDSYPTGLGAALWAHLHGAFGGHVGALCDTLIDQHPAGWSTVIGKDFALVPGYVEWGIGPTDDDQRQRQPQCYCHGERSEPATEITSEADAVRCWAEWIYIFNVEHRTMEVKALDTTTKEYTRVALVDLDGTEPDWSAMEAA